MRESRPIPLAMGMVALLILSTMIAGRISSFRDSKSRNNASRDCSGLLALISGSPYFTFGFRNFLADVAWLEAVQTAGEKRLKDADYRLLSCQLDIVSDFDPRFTMPYLLGGLFLSESDAHSKDALALLSKGKPHHSTDWRFPFYIGYIQYFSLGDTTTAGRSMEEAARLPGSPPYLPMLATRMLSEAKDPEAALALLSSIADQETDPIRQRALERRIREVVVEKDLQTLERAVEAYRRVTGRSPETLTALVETGMIRAVPREPNGGKYVMDRGGMVRSNRVRQRLQVFRKR